MKKMLKEGNQIHNYIYSSGYGTVINYGSGSGSNFSTSYGSGYTTLPLSPNSQQRAKPLLFTEITQ
jgi:hypothetical protein